MSVIVVFKVLYLEHVTGLVRRLDRRLWYLLESDFDIVKAWSLYELVEDSARCV